MCHSVSQCVAVCASRSCGAVAAARRLWRLVCCSELQHVAASPVGHAARRDWCVASVLQCDAVCCSMLQCVPVGHVGQQQPHADCRDWCASFVASERLRWRAQATVAVCCRVLRCVTVCCNVLQCVALCCSV